MALGFDWRRFPGLNEEQKENKEYEEQWLVKKHP
jgi:hypothetical protein